MIDDFDAFLSNALSPPDGEPDRAFVRRVQAQIRLADHLRAERRGLLKMFVIQSIGIAAIAGALFWLLRSPFLANFASEWPALLLLSMLSLFSLVLLLVSGPTSYNAGVLSKLNGG